MGKRKPRKCNDFPTGTEQGSQARVLSAVLLCLQVWIYEARSPLSQGSVIIPFQMRKQAWGGRGPSAGEAAGKKEGCLV